MENDGWSWKHIYIDVFWRKIPRRLCIHYVDAMLMQATTWLSWGRRGPSRKWSTTEWLKSTGRRRSSYCQLTSTTSLAPSRRRSCVELSTLFRSTSSVSENGCRRHSTTLLTASKLRPLIVDISRWGDEHALTFQKFTRISRPAVNDHFKMLHRTRLFD